ncbi:MAG: hypothetical protein ABIP75_14560 [Pyrinomonadaceae bacterium]
MDVNEKILIGYLLGELPEGERSALEERYFADSRIFDQLVAAENKLVDKYARGQLTDDLRVRLERTYLADPARRDRVKFAQAFAEKTGAFQAAAAPLPRVSWLQNLLAGSRSLKPAFRYSLAFATLLVVLFGAWLLVNAWRRQREAAQIQANTNQQERERADQSERERKRAEEIANGNDPVRQTPLPPLEPTPTPKPSSEPRSVTLALTIGGVRGGGGSATPTLALAPATTQVRLVLRLTDNDYPTYRATLRSVSSAAILSQLNVKPRTAGAGVTIIFTVPATKLVGGDYVLTISGVDPNGDIDDLGKSLFRVDRK